MHVEWSDPNTRETAVSHANHFARSLILNFLNRYSQASCNLSDELTQEKAIALFQEAFQIGFLPMVLHKQIGAPPRGWWHVNQAIRDYYGKALEHTFPLFNELR